MSDEIGKIREAMMALFNCDLSKYDDEDIRRGAAFVKTLIDYAETAGRDPGYIADCIAQCCRQVIDGLVISDHTP
jgi:hypothetical protein